MNTDPEKNLNVTLHLLVDMKKINLNFNSDFDRLKPITS